MKNSKLSAALKAKWASGTRKPSPRSTYEKSSATMRRLYATGKLVRSWTVKPREQIAKAVSKANQGKVMRKTPMSEAEKLALAQRMRTNPKTAAGIENIRVRSWRLRSPGNVVYEFRNVRIFVEQHPELFAPEDLQWRRKPANTSYTLTCRAHAGLMSLSPRKKIGPGSWKGWTWYSQTERLKNDGADLLDREHFPLPS